MPDVVYDVALQYAWPGAVPLTVRLGVQGMSYFFADDANTVERFVPAHAVWDLTAEAKVYKDIVSVNAGINNLFNEDYHSRVTDTGIDPGYGRNYYIGVSLKF